MGKFDRGCGLACQASCLETGDSHHQALSVTQMSGTDNTNSEEIKLFSTVELELGTGAAEVLGAPDLYPPLSCLWVLCQILIAGFFSFLKGERVTPPRDRKIWPIVCVPCCSSVRDGWLLYGSFNRPCLIITVRHRRAAFSSNGLVAIYSHGAVCPKVTLRVVIL